MLKSKKKEGKVKTGKHTNKIEIKIDYDKGSAVPNGIRIHKDCTMLDLIVAITRLTEVACEESAAQGKPITTFLVNCAKAYIDQADVE